MSLKKFTWRGDTQLRKGKSMQVVEVGGLTNDFAQILDDMKDYRKRGT